MWSKQVTSLREEVASLAKYKPAEGAAGARPLTPRPDWARVSLHNPESGQAEALADRAPGSSTAENVQALVDHIAAAQPEMIVCQGDGPEVPLYLRWGGQPGTAEGKAVRVRVQLIGHARNNM